jgi:arylsulfatase
MGVVPEGTELPPRNDDVLPWDEVPDDHRRLACRLQEAYAAMLEHTDDQIGRLLAFLDAHDLGDDTLIMVLSDNGASREGGPFGVMDEFSFFNLLAEDIDHIAEHRLDDIGGPHSHSNYPWGWAQAGNSPLRWFKSNTYGGGVRDPLIVRWPARLAEEQVGAIRPQFCHAVDIAATVLDATGVSMPAQFLGVEQLPLHGRSLLPTFDDPDAAPPRSVQYFEQMGHRGIWADGWKATTYHVPGQPYDDDEWGLYHLEADFSECRDLAAAQPERLRQMIDAWWTEAGTHGVLPLDDRTIELFGAPARPGSPHAVGGRYEYLHPISHIPADASPQLGGRPWEATAHVTVAVGQPVEGVLYARGGHNLGHVLFVHDGQLQFDYNALGHHTRVAAPIDLDPGDHRLAVRFDRVERAGRVTLVVDGEDQASADVPVLVRMLGSIGLDVGRNPLSPVVDDYPPPFPFTAGLHRVVFEIHGRRTAADVEAQARVEMANE